VRQFLDSNIDEDRFEKGRNWKMVIDQAKRVIDTRMKHAWETKVKQAVEQKYSRVLQDRMRRVIFTKEAAQSTELYKTYQQALHESIFTTMASADVRAVLEEYLDRNLRAALEGIIHNTKTTFVPNMVLQSQNREFLKIGPQLFADKTKMKTTRRKQAFLVKSGDFFTRDRIEKLVAVLGKKSDLAVKSFQSQTLKSVKEKGSQAVKDLSDLSRQPNLQAFLEKLEAERNKIPTKDELAKISERTACETVRSLMGNGSKRQRTH